ncbi:MAG: hypothetical protein GF346_10165 [Candidatus Eisenbacteria bacterium]|nr:hypothetical protein [Candidatus Latescibacterota bacterium]MBD3302799.1 hypothetical protein [Candidatus Eisenbacteria bacterium]
MRAPWILLLGLLFLHGLSHVPPLAPGVAHAAVGFGSVLLGYDGGPGGSLEATLTGLVPSAPLSVRLGLGRSSRPAGNGAEARRIFINNATNGTIEKSGWTWVTRFDVVHPIGRFASGDLTAFAGPRHSRYTARFRYVGGNEEFDVTSHQWGWGGGLETKLAMGGRTALLLRGGVDYFLEAPLHGHDTRYDPGGEDVNPREDYGYGDADRAVEQPRLLGRVMAGIRVRLGS